MAAETPSSLCDGGGPLTSQVEASSDHAGRYRGWEGGPAECDCSLLSLDSAHSLTSGRVLPFLVLPASSAKQEGWPCWRIPDRRTMATNTDGQAHWRQPIRASRRGWEPLDAVTTSAPETWVGPMG